MYFDETQLNDHVLDALYDMRFDKCTPIQEQCIPPILEGRDLLGVAQTGTGKTAAYLLPILSKLDDGGYPADAINCVIMSPTRELAQQIDQAMQGFGYYLSGVSSVAVYGGNDGNRYDQELKSFQMGADVVIATPGRLISHISLGSADLSKVSFFVLDEADRMLDMGFSEDIKMIASKLPPTCQTIMFSATMPEKIEELAKTLLKNPVEVKIAVSKPAEKIKQSAYVCYETQKIGIIKDLFRKGDLNRVIIFSGKKQKVKAINRTLQQMKINSGEMHSDLEQAERDDILYKFKSGQIDVLVATDIVARGIDIDDIAMVINFDVPHDPEDYVHRIGRTARAQRDGIAITFVADDEIYSFKQIEKFLEREVEKIPLPEGLGDAPDYNAPSGKGRGRNGRSRGAKDGGERGGRKQGEGRGRRNGKKTAGDKSPEAGTDTAKAKQDSQNQQKAQTVKTQQPSQTQQDVQQPKAQQPSQSQQPAQSAKEQQPSQSQQGEQQPQAAQPSGDKPKRKRKPRRKPASATEQPGASDTQQPSRKPRQRKPHTEERGADSRQDTNVRSTRQNADRPKRRNGNRPSGATRTEEPKVSVPAVKQPGTLTKILKSPISWIKSLGKKKD